MGRHFAFVLPPMWLDGLWRDNGDDKMRFQVPPTTGWTLWKLLFCVKHSAGARLALLLDCHATLLASISFSKPCSHWQKTFDAIQIRYIIE